MDIIPKGLLPLSHDELLERAGENDALVPGDSFDGNIDFPIIHATTTQKARKIIDEGKIVSFETLTERDDVGVRNNMKNNTDELDEFLGFDRYVFTSLGKINPEALTHYNDVIFLCFRFDLVSQLQGVVAAIKEIAELGAWVSKEGGEQAFLALGMSERDIQEANREAIEEFYKRILTMEGLRNFLGELIKHYPNFIGDITFPGEDVEYQYTQAGKSISNYWQGPQIMLPGELSLDTLDSIVCFNKRQYRSLSSKMKRNGLLKSGKDRNLFSLDKVSSDVSQAVGRQVGRGKMSHMFINILLTMIHRRMTSPEDMKEFFGVR